MVEKDSETPKRGPRKVDWIAVHTRWSEGRSAAWIADQFGLQPATVSLRCGWIDTHFPPTAPARFKATLARRLEASQAALEAGEPIEAERQAKALLAIVRAAKAVEEWIMDNDAAETPADPGPEANAHDDPRAELERRIAHLVAEEFKREPYTAGAGGPGQAGSDRADAGGEPGED